MATTIEWHTLDIVSQTMNPTTTLFTDDSALLPETEADAEKIVTNKTICIALTLKRMGTRRKVSSTTDAIETETDRALLLINKLIIDSPELDSIIVLDGQIRAAVKKKALTVEMPLRGCYLLPTSVVSALDEQLVELKKQRDELIALYVTWYPTRMGQAKDRLGMLFNPNDYLHVDQVASAFNMEWTYPEPVKVATNLKEISNHIFSREISKMGERCQEMLQQVEVGLVDYMNDFVDKLIDSLSIKADGKPKVFKGATVQNFLEFLKQLPEMNISNNQKLSALGEKAKSIMSGVDVQTLRTDLPIRKALQEKMKAFKDADLSSMVDNRPERKVSFASE